jgi:membrane protein
VGPAAAGALRTIIVNGRNHGAGIIGTVVGSVLLVVSATGVFSELQTSLNKVWGVDQARGGLKGTLVKRLYTFVTLLGVGLILLVSLLASALVAGLGHRVGDSVPAASVLLQIAEFLVFLGIITLLMALIFKLLPDAEIRWKDVWAGAVVTSALFSVGKLLIGLYLGRSSTSSSYGAAASFVVLLIWIYYSAQILLFGAEFTAVYARRRGGGHGRVSGEGESAGRDAAAGAPGSESGVRREASGQERPKAPQGGPSDGKVGQRAA